MSVRYTPAISVAPRQPLLCASGCIATVLLAMTATGQQPKSASEEALRPPPHLVLPGISSTEPTVIRGQVVGPRGEPVANAFVGAVIRRHSSDACLPPPGRSEAIGSCYSDRNGRFEIAGRPLRPPAEQELTVFACAAGNAVTWQELDVYRNEHAAVLQMSSGRSIKGRITDSAGVPVAGIKVALKAMVLGPTGERPISVLLLPSDPLEFGPLVSTTDETGAFELSQVHRSAIHVAAEIQDPQFMPQMVSLPVRADSPATFELTSVLSLRGTLRYERSGEAVEEGDVFVTSHNGPGGISATKAKLDEQGQFRCSPYFGERYSFGVVTTDGVYLRLRTQVIADECFKGSIDLLLPEGAHVRSPGGISPAETEASRSVTVLGVARDSDGNPISRGIAVTSSYNPAGDSTLPIRDGYFTVPNLAPDEHCRLYLLDVANQLGAIADFRAGSGEPVEVVLTPCGSAVAELTDIDGKPYADAHLLRNEAPAFSLQLILTNPGPAASRGTFGPIVQRAELVQNFDRDHYRHLRTTEQGQVTFPTLIPGAEYRITTSENIFIRLDGTPVGIDESVAPAEVYPVHHSVATRRRFHVDAGQVLDVGQVRIPNEQQSRLPAFDHPAGAGTPLGPAEEIRKAAAQISRISPAVIPAVVFIEVPGGSKGSGVVVSEDGLVLSAAHVGPEPGATVTVHFPDGRSTNGVALGKCESTDAQMIKLAESDETWPFVVIRRSTNVQPGSWCWAAGYPASHRVRSPDLGALTPVYRIGRVAKVNPISVATVTSVNGGDSGGPLFDLDGKLIGINSASKLDTPDLAVHVATDFFLDHWQRLKDSQSWRVYLSRR